MSGTRVARTAILVACAVFFLLPIYSMADFSTRGDTGGRTGQAWSNLFTDPALTTSIINSLLLAVVTVVLMLVLLLPTMIWVRLRLPRATRLVEALCLLPLAVPALVIVVGINGVYSWVYYFLGDSPLTLSFVYVILVLPFAYRSLDAALSSIDVSTLAEAAQSLGASWFRVIVQVIAPNVWGGVMAAAFISVALVLGEFTFSSLLNFDTFPVAIALLGKTDAATSVSAALASMIFVTALLLMLSFLDRSRSRESRMS